MQEIKQKNKQVLNAQHPSHGFRVTQSASQSTHTHTKAWGARRGVEEERWGYRGGESWCVRLRWGEETVWSTHTLVPFPAEFLFRGYRREATKTKG